MWTCSLNSACEPLRPAQCTFHSLKCIYTHHGCAWTRKEKWTKKDEKKGAEIKINMFIWHFSLDTHFLMHCKRASAFQSHFPNVYLSVCMPAIIAMNRLTVSHGRVAPRLQSLYSIVYFCNDVTTNSKLISTRQTTELFMLSIWVEWSCRCMCACVCIVPHLNYITFTVIVITCSFVGFLVNQP